MEAPSSILCPRCGYDPTRHLAPLGTVDTTLQTGLVRDLLCSNIPPSDSEIAYIQKNRLDRSPLLHDLDEQIAKTRVMLEILLQEKERVLADCTRYAAILHPHRRVPTEIVCKVFEECILDSVWSIENAPDSLSIAQMNWVVTHVSSSWRRAAISLPTIWSSIGLKLKSRDSRSPDRGLGGISLLNLQLQHSMTIPLSVWISWERYYGANHLYHPLLNAILSTSQRWKRLFATAPTYQSLLPPDQYSFPLLETLHINTPYLVGVTNDFHLIPNLRVLSASININLPASALLLKLIRYCSFDGADPFPLLRVAPNLQECELIDIVCSNLDPNDDICLSKLWSLVISSEYDDGVGLCMSCLTLPSLTHLVVMGGIESTDCIIDLLRRSQASLIHLKLDLLSIIIRSDDILLQILQLSPKLESLELDGSLCFTDEVVRQLTSGVKATVPLAPCLSELVTTGSLPCSSSLFTAMVTSRKQLGEKEPSFRVKSLDGVITTPCL